MFQRFLTSDARNFQILAQGIFLFTGILFLGWTDDLFRFPLILSTALLVQYAGDRFLLKKSSLQSMKSATITSLGLTLILRTGHPLVYVLAAVMAIGSKFVFRPGNRHFFNPTNFAIASLILFTNYAWISPGQWGTAAFLIFLIGVPAMMILTKSTRLDVALSFIITLFTLDFFRTVLYQNWDLAFFLHKFSNGSLLLFTFFMITDPVTTPQHPKARMAWGAVVAVASFVLSNYFFIHTAPMIALFFMSMMTPLVNYLFRYKTFHWNQTQVNPLSKFTLKPVYKAVAIIGLCFITQFGFSFCGFYVAKADANLYNNKSQVILVRNGNYTSITMSSDFKGNVKDFAMVVPVPTVLKRDEIRISDNSLFKRLDDYSAPRLASYYDSNPCMAYQYDDMIPMSSMAEGNTRAATVAKRSEAKNYGVTIEATYQVDEYEVLILSATESEGLKNWLTDNGYKIPEKAEKVLTPYIRSNLKFFVVKVNLEKFKQFNASGYNKLRPIQISFQSPKFMLPLRLGMANSTGEQDMLVYAFTRSGRIEAVNYRTVKIPTDREVPLFVKDHFGKFYSDLFTKTYRNEGQNCVFLEYAWNASPNWGVKCDPCVGNPPMMNDMMQAGVNWFQNNNGWGGNNTTVFFTRLHVRYTNQHFPQDILFLETPNQENFQGRYVIHYPAQGDLSCEAGKAYRETLTNRKTRELHELSALTGWPVYEYQSYRRNSYYVPEEVGKKSKVILPVGNNSDEPPHNWGNRNWAWAFISLIICIAMILVPGLYNKSAQ
jgi:hypothetical protein